MIDVHSHILPSIDDGAKTLEDSLIIGRKAVEEGVTSIVATPHHLNGVFSNEGQSIISKVLDLQESLNHAGIPLRVLPGQEPRIHGEFVEHLRDGTVLPVNGTAYVLIELPHDSVPAYTEKVLYDIQLAGYKPILVHPERNTRIQENPAILYGIVSKGVYAQVTAASLTGKFGKKVARLSHDFIKANLVHIIASDVHNTHSRTFFMKGAFESVRHIHGRNKAEELEENAHALVEGKSILADPPGLVKKRRLFW